MASLPSDCSRRASRDTTSVSSSCRSHQNTSLFLFPELFLCMFVPSLCWQMPCISLVVKYGREKGVLFPPLLRAPRRSGRCRSRTTIIRKTVALFLECFSYVCPEPVLIK